MPKHAKNISSQLGDNFLSLSCGNLCFTVLRFSLNYADEKYDNFHFYWFNLKNISNTMICNMALHILNSAFPARRTFCS